MEKLTITKARIKNFLSYGNEWQEIIFKKGMTLVQGFNLDTNKSNGSGKSSITEVIPFAIFGKTIKDLPQSKIVNWNNRSGCEVQLFFNVGEKSYIFKRGLKPNKFKVVCDGLDVVRPADIRAFQLQMEEEVIGMDFKTFKNLIYFSPNNTISILGAGKEQKRLFLESLFDLSEYSELLKLTNIKIGEYTDKVKDSESSKLQSNQFIDMIGRDIESYTTIPINQAETQLNSDTNKLAIMLSSRGDITPKNQETYNLLKSHLETLKELHISLNNTIVETTTKISHIQKDIDSTDLTDLENKTSKIKDDINKLEKVISDNKDNVELYTSEIPEILSTIEDIKKSLSEKTALINETKQNIALKKQLIETCKDNITKLENADQLEGKSECPLCKNKVDHLHISHWYIEEIENVTWKMRAYEDELVALEAELSGITGDVESLKIRGRELAETYKAKQAVISNNVDDYFALEALKKNANMLPNIVSLKIDLEKKRSDIVELKEVLSDTEWKYNLNSEDIEGKQKQLDTIDEAEKKAETIRLEIEKLTNNVEVSQSNLSKLIEIKTNQDEQIDNKKKDIDKYRQSLVLYENNLKKFNKMLDYLNYIRSSLKDENVKQFAISALLPYLNHRANHYLSESGFPYMVTIDGWLDVTIRGMGTEDVGYNSLSGGESKAMDMAVQLACNDIAELQAKTSLNIAIYDEILDTSLDADGVQKLMDIVRVKQKETDSCVLCITHRDEIKELEFDNNIMIHKQNGFSSIQ
jgi:DNA repair exonuclease SbcCD ATPase subunit